MAGEVIDFDLIDDVLNLPKDEYSRILRRAAPAAIGPIIEFLYVSDCNLESRLQCLPSCEVVTRISKALKVVGLDACTNAVSGDFRTHEFIRTPQSEMELSSPKWSSFLVRAQRAAEASGIEKALAQALIGTLGEMVDNIIWHSKAARSGLAAYQWSSDRFEYVVADAGIGVPASLRSNRLYKAIDDPLELLCLALENGSSRFPKHFHRGTGFNALLRNIAKKGSDLRFHSDSACAVFEGSKSFAEGIPIIQKVRTVPNLNGFVISVSTFPYN